LLLTLPVLAVRWITPTTILCLLGTGTIITLIGLFLLVYSRR